METNPSGPGHTTTCVPGQNSEWWCGAQQMLYQEWLRVDGDMKRQANTSHKGDDEGTGSHTSLYIGAGAAIVAAIAISWLLVIAVHENVKRREERRRILCPQRRYDYTDDIEHALGAEREERERGYAPTIE